MKRTISSALVAVFTLIFAAPCLAEEPTAPAPAVTQEQAEPEVDGGSYGAAGVSNVVFIPAKAGSCAMSGILWFAGMVLTGGSRYKLMGDFAHDACTGQWVIKGEDMATNKKGDWFLVD